MNVKSNDQTASATLDAAIAGGGSVELVAIVTAMIFVACAAALLLLTTPATLEAVASTAPVAITTDVAEKPFHERYRITAAEDSPDSPTF